MSAAPRRDHLPHGAFGQDAFGRSAERAARFFGTPQYILGQSAAVLVWIVLNTVALVGDWDPYPFILLNLAFSTQAAYAAPLILLAQTRQADRDKAAADHVERRHQEQQRHAAVALAELRGLLESNTELTRQDKELTEQVAALARSIEQRLGRG